jgi:putative ABC transport system permease protein
MWKNYLVVVYRNIIRQKLNTLINILGLAAGISAGTLIFLYVHTELNYDRYWKDTDNLYRVNEVFDYHKREATPYAVVSHMLGKRMIEEFPGIQVCRVEKGNYGKNIFIDDEWIDPGTILHADDNFFKLFTYPRDFIFLETDTLTNAWVSEKLYETHFEPFDLDVFKYGNKTFQVAGVFSKSGYQSHLNVDLVIPFDTLMLNDRNRNMDWTRLNSSLYVRTDLPQEKLEAEINNAFRTEVDTFTRRYEMNMDIRFPVIPVKDIHFSNAYQYDSMTNGDRQIVWLFSIIGFLILTIASINYINMAIAQGGIRAKEIAIRKTMGASRKNIIVQFLGESIAITLFAILISIVFSEMLFPAFNQITGFDFHIFEIVILQRMLGFLIVVWIVLGFISGFYPAFVLSLFQPITIFRSGADLILYRNVRSYFVSSTKVRKTMLIGQYLVAGTIIISTIIIQLQNRYLMNRDLGFDLNNLLIMELERDSTRETKYENLLNTVLELEDVHKATLANRVPGMRTGRLLFYVPTDTGIYQNGFDFYSGKPDYLETLGCEVTSGRWFDPDAQDEELYREILVNEAFVKEMNWSNPLGRQIGSGFMTNHKVVGVIKNFNYYSLHQKVMPLVILPDIFPSQFLVINSYSPYKLLNNKSLYRIWNSYFPYEAPKVQMLKTAFNSQYNREHRLLSIFAYFSGLSIIISSLGLFALSAFSAQKRSKDISIRKILGAGSKHIIQLLYLDYMQIFALATLLAWLGSFIFANQWLSTFVASVSPGVIPYLIGSFLVLGIVTMTVSYHTIKALRIEPAYFLKYE